MAEKTKIQFENTLNDGLQTYFKKMGIGEGKGEDLKAKKKVALQMLDYIIQGSPRENITPPLLHGILRGSASVFVGNIMVKANGNDANRNHSDNINTITIGFDAAYAARMHEHMVPSNTPDPIMGKLFQPSERSKSAGGGGKFVEAHLKADGKTLLELYADFIRSAANDL